MAIETYPTASRLRLMSLRVAFEQVPDLRCGIEKINKGVPA
ncbi:hypothetical protein EBBID32_17080 [Sphingobium indicum BiD32]|uniref:Uncharacterized protein n=1 Tax=Sphingobium indicum BiD32 TaxID=1301087 RepID=N1MKT8_9SPHN|nr:hypothetical protein EBBID32_17080 [Sphingobium indicum BiD32]